MGEKSAKIAATVEIPNSGLPAPSAANWFSLSHHQGEVQILVGYLDIYGIAMLARGAQEGNLEGSVSIKPDVTHRIMVSTAGMLQLRAQIEEIFQVLRQAGVLTESESPETPSGGTPVVR